MSVWNGEPNNSSTTAPEFFAMPSAAPANRLLPIPPSPCSSTVLWLAAAGSIEKPGVK